MSDTLERPQPRMQGLTAEFYDWCAKGELRFQRCSSCAAWRHAPREMCARCGSFDWSWERSSGRGRVFTWTVVERPMHPAFQHDAPYAVVVVEMDEGVRLASRVIDCDAAALEIGMPVQVRFERVSDAVMLPFFTRAAGEERGAPARSRARRSR
jgi:uncharacterized OB-fold protein